MEVWKKIEGFENYEVSNLVRVKSMPREICNVIRWYISKEKFLKPYLSNKGYYVVSINSNPKSIHQLVAIAFLGHKPCKYELVIDHIDNNKLNNNLDNLQIVSARENSTKDRKSKTNSSCVYFVNNKYCVRMQVDGKKLFLGSFNLKKEAESYYIQCLDRIKNNLTPIKKPSTFSSKFKGICWNKINKRWQVYYKEKYIGSFIFEDDAIKFLNKYIKLIQL
jgi:hypothetical protein